MLPIILSRLVALILILSFQTAGSRCASPSHVDEVYDSLFGEGTLSPPITDHTSVSPPPHKLSTALRRSSRTKTVGSSHPHVTIQPLMSSF